MSALEVDVAGRVGSFGLDVRFAGDGGVTALFGPSGAGTSTVVNMIGGLVRPRRGRIVVGDQVVFDSARGIDVPTHRRRIGHVFQEGRLFPHLSVRHNLLYGRWFAQAPADPGRFDEIVELLGIAHLLGRRPRSLAALLMDEPLASLDAPRKAEILPYLERLRRQARLPIVYVSHSIDEVARLARTMVLMSEGRVAAVGPMADVMTRLDLRPLTGRFEAGVVVEGRIAAHDDAYQLSAVAIGDQQLAVPRLEAPPGTPVRLRIRARDVALALRPPQETSIQNLLRGRVVELGWQDGPFVEVNVAIGDDTRLTARLTRRAADDVQLTAGGDVCAVI